MKKSIIDHSRVATAGVIILLTFILTLIFVGNKENIALNAAEIITTDKKVLKNSLNIGYLMQEQKTFNIDQKKTNEKVLQEFKELNKLVLSLKK